MTRAAKAHIDLHAFQRDIDAFDNTFCTEVKVLRRVPSQLRTQNIRFSRNLWQNSSQHHLAHPPAVVSRCVDVVDATVYRDVDATQRLGNIDRTKLGANGGGSEAEHG